MKYLIAAVFALNVLSAQANDEYPLNDGTVFKTTDDSMEAQLCLAALESREALKKKARELKVGNKTLNRVVCNDMSLVEFAKAHRDDMRDWAIATVQ